jgi:hypothetical protein
LIRGTGRVLNVGASQQSEREFMANKNTLRRRRLNGVQVGQGAVPSQNWERNMELVRVNGRTVYRPIDPAAPSFPKRNMTLDQARRAWGQRPSKPRVVAVIKADNKIIAVSVDSPAQKQETA